MELLALKTRYDELCKKQSALRLELLQVNIEKMVLATRITAATFNKPPPNLEDWRRHLEAGLKAGHQ